MLRHCIQFLHVTTKRNQSPQLKFLLRKMTMPAENMVENRIDMLNDDQVQTLVKEQGDLIRNMKATNADPSLISVEVEKLLRLKESIRKEKGETVVNYALKCPRGTRDYDPEQMAVREKVIAKIIDVFKRHGAETIDTPVFELRETLMGKYGDEGGKLVYDVDDQGGELLSMRYDLTVPFARYCAMNRIKSFKRYQIAKVYRRDTPRMTRGRYREFYQCDFDIAGIYDVMIPESECLKIIDEILCSMEIGEHLIKVNHRQLLDGMLSVCGIKKTQFKSVCSSIDKLDKQSWGEVREEIIKEKHVSASKVDQLEPLVRIRELKPDLTCMQVIEELSATSLIKEKSAKNAFEDLKLLFSYCDALGISERIRFEPSLARGLDYYTGPIFEAVIKEFSISSEAMQGEISEDDEAKLGVGSVAGGGRYDQLIGNLMGKSAGSKEQHVPCVGLSIGIERLFAIMEMKMKLENQSIRTKETFVYVASAQKKMLFERLKLARRLWEAGIKSEIPYKKNPLMLDQFQYCEAKLIPYVIIVGDEELKKGVYKVRDVKTRIETDVPSDELIGYLRALMETYQTS